MLVRVFLARPSRSPSTTTTIPGLRKSVLDTPLGHGAIWKNVNPSYGHYDWSWLDTLMSRANQHGADVVFTLAWFPRFASTNSGSVVVDMGVVPALRPINPMGASWTRSPAIARKQSRRKGHIGPTNYGMSPMPVTGGVVARPRWSRSPRCLQKHSRQ